MVHYNSQLQNNIMVLLHTTCYMCNVYAIVNLRHTSINAEKALLISFCSDRNKNWVTN